MATAGLNITAGVASAEASNQANYIWHVFKCDFLFIISFVPSSLFPFDVCLSTPIPRRTTGLLGRKHLSDNDKLTNFGRYSNSSSSRSGSEITSEMTSSITKCNNSNDTSICNTQNYEIIKCMIKYKKLLADIPVI